MKIAHVTDFYLPRLGGVEMHVSDLARRQAAQGHEVTILTATPGTSRRLRAVPAAGSGVAVHRLADDLRRPAALHPAAVPRGRRLVLEGGYDVVHVHAGVVTPLAFAVAALAEQGVPTVATAHSLVSNAMPLFRALDAATGWTSWPVVWTAVSEFAAAPLRRLIGPGGRVHVVPNGIDAEKWAVDPLPRDPDDVLVASVMRLAPRKRPRHLLRALRLAAARMPAGVRLRAVIVGDGSQRWLLEDYLVRHRMTSWVTLAGRRTRSEIHAMYARADLFVAPATLESFGIAALEARCAGLPVVTRAGNGVSTFIVDGREGVLAESDLELAEAIARLAIDHEERRRIALHNRTTPPSITWEDTLARLDVAYAAARSMRPSADPLVTSADGSPHDATAGNSVDAGAALRPVSA